MDIWVRSQDKELICTVNALKLYADWDINKSAIFGYDTMHNGYCLGSFKNKETALQVIDDFQEHVIETQRGFLFNCARSCEATPVNYEVFQIPEDKDV